MPTSQALTQAEIAVATEAVRIAIAEDIPSWEQGLIPQATLAKAVRRAVAAIDALRDAAAGKP
jgi:hypothetical protein